MKIAYVSLTDPDAAGGIGAHLYGLAEALVEHGNEVALYVPGTLSENATRRGVRLVRIEMRTRSAFQRLRYDWRVFTEARKFRPDFVLLRLNASSLLIPVGFRCSGVLQLSEVNGPLWDELSSERRSAVSLALSRVSIFLQIRLADGFIAVTPLLTKYVERFGPAVEVPNGSNLKLRSSHVRSENLLRIGFAGAFTQWYNLDLVLDAMPEIEERAGARVEFVLVGDGPRRDVIEERVAGDSWLARRVTMHPWMQQEAALKLMCEVDVGLIPLRPKVNTDSLGSPLKMFDYLALGLPLVVPRLDGCMSVNSRLVFHYEHSVRADFVDAVLKAGRSEGVSEVEFVDLRESISWASRAKEVVQFARRLLSD